MEAAGAAPRILANRQGVAFDLLRASGSVECVITLEALETIYGLNLRMRASCVPGYENRYLPRGTVLAGIARGG